MDVRLEEVLIYMDKLLNWIPKDSTDIFTQEEIDEFNSVLLDKVFKMQKVLEEEVKNGK